MCFDRNIGKIKNFKPEIDCNEPINWLGNNYWKLRTGGFSTNFTDDECCYIRTYPLFKTCDMTLDITTKNEYKFVQIGVIYAELVTTYENKKYYSYKRLPILKLVKSDCDLSSINSYEECKDQFGDIKINK